VTSDILDLAAQRQSRGEAFALATVVRTLDVTAAKAGAKALIGEDGSISEGWIGGGCARAAVLKAAREAMADGRARLVSIQPRDLLEAQGVAPGQARGGIEFANNSCPSQGTMDVFVEPVLPKPTLLVLGASPIAVSLAALAPAMGFGVVVAAARDDLGRFDAAARRIEGFVAPPLDARHAYVARAARRPSCATTSPPTASRARSWTRSRRPRGSTSARSPPRRSRCRSWRRW
jgi:xanthine dehydrogenase accessory factor